MTSVVSVVFPVFGTVVLGYLLARYQLFEASVGAALVRFMYYVAIPAMLFKSLLEANLPAQIPWSFLMAFYVPAVLIFWAAMLLARKRFTWQRGEEGIAGVTATYSNMVMLGYPLALGAFGSEGAVPMFILLATQSIVLFPLVSFCVEAQKADQNRWRAVLELTANPIILSLVLGVVANINSVELIAELDRMFELLGAAGPGCALMALGISLAQYSLSGGYRNVAYLVIMKNFLHPLCVWFGCYMLDVNREWTYVAVLLAAMPTGINAFIFASRYEVRQETVSKVIVVSTVTSVFVTAFLLSFFLSR